MSSPFGSQLLTLREFVGWSQAKLARKARFDHSYVSRLESGVRTPSRQAVERLAQALNCNAEGKGALLAAAGFLPFDPAVVMAAEPEVVEIVRLLGDEAVPAQYRENVRQMLHAIAEGAPREATYPVS